MDCKQTARELKLVARRIGWAVAAVLIALILALLGAGLFSARSKLSSQRSVEAGVNGRWNGSAARRGTSSLG